jgi:hypothetical protein
MDYKNWSNGYSSLVNINNNSNYEYLKFLEESGTELGLESFENVRKSKKSKSKSKSSSRKSSKKGSKKGSKRKSKKTSKRKSKKSKKGSKRKSKKGKKLSKKIVTHLRGRKGKKGKKYSHKFIKKKITPKVSPGVFPSISPGVFPSISPGVFPSISPSTDYTTPSSNNSGYISLPTLANPTTTTNPFSGVITVAQDYTGYRFDPRTKFGVTFNESLSNNYTYQGWEKLKNGRYIGRPLNSFSEVVLLILEVNFGIPTADGEVSSYNSKTGVYSYTSSLGGITEGLRYDPKSYFGIDFFESRKAASYQAFTLDITGNIQAVDMETVPISVQVILGILPATAPAPAPAPKIVPTGSVIKLNPTLSYRVTDNKGPRFPSSTQIILDSRDPIFHTDGTELSSILPATNPMIGETINGPFIQFGTTVIAVQTTGTIPSDSSIPAQVITLSQPLVNITEKTDDVFAYIFTKNGKYTSSPASVPLQFVEDQNLIYRASDTGYNTQGNFATHFPSSTQIILDSRKPAFDLSGNVINFGSTADSPLTGSLISGPFVKPNTTVVSVQNSGRLSSNSYVDGQTITISQPLENIVENKGQVFIYTFTRNVTPALKQ